MTIEQLEQRARIVYDAGLPSVFQVVCEADSRAELLDSLREAVRLYENYSLVAQPVEGEGLNVGKWVTNAREVIARAS